MKDRLVQIIKTEDKKNPYTDDRLAEMLDTRRDAVTALRNELSIPNSRERRKPYLVEAIREIISKNPEISNRQLTKIIKDRGFNVSKYLISQIALQIKEKIFDLNLVMSHNEPLEHLNLKSNFNLKNTLKYPSELLAFSRIIGFDGSLKSQIQQAKAAILYPPHGLHTLILGPSGVGKSNLAEAMYDYALEIKAISETAPFIIFNCADYAENPQLLLSQLFGHVKGAYTGAAVLKKGLVEKADGGILFLDEVHRLPPEGQELLYFLMDKGKFRRMGETETERTANILIIAATTEDIESSLLLTFRRRIPMIIELPSLSVRPLDERYHIIKAFFNKEADRIGIKIKITQEALRALLMYSCPGNIGQLRSDIQVACARGFLNCISSQKEYIEVDLSDLPVHVQKGLLKIQERNPEVEYFIKEDLMTKPNQSETNIEPEPKEDLYTLPREIYGYIEERYHELELQDLTQDEINKLIGEELEIKFQQLIKRVETSHPTLAKQDLAEIVGQNIVDITEKATKIAEKRIGGIDKHLFYCLAIHLSATFERIQQGKPIVNPHLDKVMKKYKSEYNVAKEMVKHIELLSGYKIPQDEIGFIAMYLRTITSPSDEKRGRVGVLVLSHGRVAQGMAEVANRLLGVNHAVSIEMSLDEKPESALQRTIEVVYKINEGKGVLILVDMGSLITFGEIITKKTGIPTKTVGRVDTVMVLEAVRRAIVPDTNLNEIVNIIDKDKIALGRFVPSEISRNKKVIITLCITGEGTAIKIKRLIEKMLPNIKEKAEIIPMGVAGDEDISTKMNNIRKQYTVSAVIGSIDPKDNLVPFISVEEIIDGTAIEKLKKIVYMESPLKVLKNGDVIKIPFAKVIHEELIMVRPDYCNKNEVLDGLAELLIKGGFAKEKFLLDVYKREIMEPTLLKEKFAIPHGNPQNVIKPAIAIAILNNSIIWSEENEVENVFMMALKEDSTDILNNFYKLIKTPNLSEKLKKSRNPQEVKSIISEILISCH